MLVLKHPAGLLYETMWDKIRGSHSGGYEEYHLLGYNGL
jgi:hypothetical protein